MRVTCAAAIVAMLSGCGVREDPAGRTNSQSVSETKPAETSSHVYVAANASERVLAPLSPNLGRLEIVDDCLVFDMGGRDVIPLMPKGSRLVERGDELVLIRGDSSRELPVPGQTSLGGAEVALSDDTGRPAQPVPERCNLPLYVVGKE
ncbi:MAG: hypothetical protein ACK40O_01075 [Allosphingosinicella sp.]